MDRTGCLVVVYSDMREYYWTVEDTGETTTIKLYSSEDDKPCAVHTCTPNNGVIIKELKEQIQHLRNENVALRQMIADILNK